MLRKILFGILFALFVVGLASASDSVPTADLGCNYDAVVPTDDEVRWGVADLECEVCGEMYLADIGFSATPRRGLTLHWRDQTRWVGFGDFVVFGEQAQACPLSNGNIGLDFVGLE